MKNRLSLLLAVVFQLVIGSHAFANGTVMGSVFEQDGFTPIADASVTFSTVNLQGDTISYQFHTDSFGSYYGTMIAGEYQAVAFANGYADSVFPTSIVLNDDAVIEHIDFVLHELYSPVQYFN